jgi:sugar lactone lactonase YvrE
MKNLTLFLIGFIHMAHSFGQAEKIEFIAPSAYPEGIVYDPMHQVFYVSSVRFGTIGKIDMQGKYTVVYSDSSLKSTFGIKLYDKKLWVCVSDPHFSKYRDSSTYKKMIRLVSIDPSTGKKVDDIDLSKLYNGPHFGNDVAIDNKGNKYITDSYSPVIYKVDNTNKASVFTTSPLFGAVGTGLNGIAIHPDGFLIVVNNAKGSILKIDLANPPIVSKVKIDQFFPGADGLLIDESKKLILVQNKGVNKIFRIVTTDNWQSAKVEAHTLTKDIFSYPSTATFYNKEAWIMNARLNELQDSNVVESKKFSVQKARFVPVK